MFHQLNEPVENRQQEPRRKSTAQRLARFSLRILIGIAVTVMFGKVLQFSVRHSQREGKIPGFTTGIAHGALMPCGFPMLLMGQDLPIYAEQNSGRTYKLGYTLGVNLCGALFFGSVYWRVGRLRKLTQELRE